MEPLLLFLVATLLVSGTYSAGCPGEKPLKRIVCRQRGPLPDQFDPCLCTHLVLHKDINQLSQSEVQAAVVGYKATNPWLEVVAGVEAGKGPELAQLAHRLELDGVLLTATHNPSSSQQLHRLVKELAIEFDSLRSQKRATEKYESTTKSSASEREHSTGISVELPANPQILGKYFDLKKLSKYVDFYVMATENITDISEKGFTYHPSRLMGIEDVLNADSLVDLVSGLGAPIEKLVLSLPATASRFTLDDATNNMPRAPAKQAPVALSQSQLCETLAEGTWTLERDEDLTAPYAYANGTWLAFDDPMSVAIKGKYILLRELGGGAVSGVEAEDWSDACKRGRAGLLSTLHETFTTVARKPRAAQLLALQDQIHQAYNLPFSDVELSPYRIVRVVDRAGAIHVVRKEAKTEFACTRQGYFTHPSGCNRFYRCVKFNQYSSDFTVFEYDCPAGLAFDERYEVCVWPGSLPDANPCKGSSEIAPVPRNRFACPSTEGYYADPENCRWFFACLDHKRDGSPPTAYEFRCPFGLVFNEKNLVCDWPWNVEGCGSGRVAVASVGLTAADLLEGRLRPSYANVPDVLVSGGRIENVDGGFVLGSQLGLGRLNGISYSGESSNINPGISGSGLLSSQAGENSANYIHGHGAGSRSQINNQGASAEDSGAYIHDPTGDHGGDYIHDGREYVHDGRPYVQDNFGSLYGGVGKDSGALNQGVYSHRESAGLGNVAYTHDSRGGYQDGSGVTYTGTVTPSTVHVSGSGAQFSGIDNSGSYLHDNTGDHGGEYVHQDGGFSKTVSSFGLGSTSSAGGAPSIDNSGFYVNDNRGQYEDGSSGSYSVTGSGSTSSTGSGATLSHGSVGLGLRVKDSGTFSQNIQSNLDGQNVYHGHSGDYSGTTVGAGVVSVPVAGISVGYSSSKDNSGAYVHDSRGDYQGSAEKEFVSSNFNIGKTQVIKTGINTDVPNIEYSGAYVHDSRGDNGGDYIHQGGHYIHQGGEYIHQGGEGGALGHSVLVGQTVINQGSGVAGGVSSVSNSGAYVHDSRGDRGGDYIHQAGKIVSASGEGYSQHFGTKSTDGKFSEGQYNLYNTGTYSQGNAGGYVHDNAGVYVHDNRPYTHSTGLQGGQYSYVPNDIYYAGTYRKYTDKDFLANYFNIIGGSNGQSYNQGSYSHDLSGKYVPELYTVGKEGSYYAGNYGNYVNLGSNVQPAGVSTTYFKGKGVGGYTVPVIGSPVTHSTGYSGIGGSAFIETKPVIQSQFGLKTHNLAVPTVTASTPLEGIYKVSTPRPISYKPSYVSPALSSVVGVGHYAKVTPTVTVSSTPVAPLNPVQYSVTPRPVNIYTPDQLDVNTYNQQVTKFGFIRPGVVGSLSTPVVSHSFKQPVSAFTVTEKPFVSVTTPVPSVSTVSHFKSGLVQPISVSSTPVVPVNPVHVVSPLSVSTPAPPVVSYSYQQPISQTKFVQAKPSVVTYQKPAVSYEKASVVSTYLQPSLITTHEQPAVVSTFVQPQVVSTYQKPSITKFDSTFNRNIYKGAEIRPLQTVEQQLQFVEQKPIFTYDKQAVRPYNPIVISTPSPFKAPVSISVSSTPAVPLNPIQYVRPVPTTPAPSVSYSYRQPVVGTVYTEQRPILSTPAPAVLSYQEQHYLQGVNEPVVSFYPKRKPVIVSSTPAVPLNPVQYVSPTAVTHLTKVHSYSEQQPIQQFSFNYENKYPTNFNEANQHIYSKTENIRYSQPLKPVVSSSVHDFSGYHYEKPSVAFSLPERKPAIASYSFKQPAIRTEVLQPVVVSSTPVPPLNPVQYVKPLVASTSSPPIFSYSYNRQPVEKITTTFVKEQPNLYSYQPIKTQFISEAKPYKPVVVSTVATPIVSYSYEQKPLTKVSYEKPIVVSTPSPAVFSHQQEFVKPLIPSSTVTYPAVGGTYKQQVIKTDYVRPLPESGTPAQSVIYQQTNVKTGYQPSVLVSTPAPVVDYSFQQPALKTGSVKTTYYQPEVVSSTPSPIVTYQQPQIRTDYVKTSYVKPALVSSTPAPSVVHFQQPAVKTNYIRPVVVSTTASPAVVDYSYKRPIVKTDYVSPVTVSSTVIPHVDYSFNSGVTKTDFVSPIAVTSSPVVPLNPVQYVKPVTSSPPLAFSYSYKRPVQEEVPYNQQNTNYYSYSYQKPVSDVRYVSQQASGVTSDVGSIDYAYQLPSTYASKDKLAVNYQQSHLSTGYAQPAFQQQYFNVKTVVPEISTTPAIPLNPVQYVKNSGQVLKYSYSAPVKPLKVAEVSSYSYEQPLEPVVLDRKVEQTFVNVPAAHQVTYTSQKTVRPVAVSTTPVAPINKIQFVSQPVSPVFVTTTVRPTTVEEIYPNLDIQKVSTVVESKPVTPLVSRRPIVPVVTTTSQPVDFNYYQQPIVGYEEANFNYNLHKSNVPAPFTKTYSEKEFTGTYQQPAVISLKDNKPNAVFEEYFEANRNIGQAQVTNFESVNRGTAGFVDTRYSVPVVKSTTEAPAYDLYNSRVTSYNTRIPTRGNIYSTTVSPSTSPEVKYTVRYRPTKTYVTEEPSSTVSYVSSENYDENLNVNVDIPRISINEQSIPISTTTYLPSTISSANPTVKKVRVNGGTGYYVRKQKVRVRPVVTTTENYPAFYSTTIRPTLQYSSTLDLSSPTLYRTTVTPVATSSLRPAELEVANEENDQQLIDEVSGQFGEVIIAGNKGVIEQKIDTYSGLSTTTVSSLKDGEAIVGVIKKERVGVDGRKKKAKVVVVSRLSDFNPILVGKLGAQCSCQSESNQLNLRRGGSKRVKGRLFAPDTVPTEYSTASSQEYVSSTTTLAPQEYEQRIIEIKPLRKSQRVYSTTTAPYTIQAEASYENRGRKISTSRGDDSSDGYNTLDTSAKVAGASFDRYGPGGLRGADETLQGSVDCQRAGLFRHPKFCNKFYSCNWDPWKKRFTLHVFNCPVHLAYDSNLGACNWPSKGPACADDNLLV